MPLETFTTTGLAERSSSGRNAWVTRTMPSTLVSRTRPTSVGGRVGDRRCASPTMPALLTSTSRPPSAATRSAAAATLASSVTSSSDEAGAERLGGRAAAVRVAGADPDVVAVGEEAAGGLAAEALVGSGDQRRGHALHAWPPAAPAAPEAAAAWDSTGPPAAPGVRHHRTRGPRRARRLPALLARPAPARPTSACPPAARAARPGCGARRSRSSPACRSTTSRGSSRAARRNPSPSVLAPLARALRLTDDERDAPVPRRRPRRAGRRADATATSRPACSACSTGSPTCRCSWSTPSWQVVAANPLAHALIGDHLGRAAARAQHPLAPLHRRAVARRAHGRGGRRRRRPSRSPTSATRSAATPTTSSCARWSRTCAASARGSPSCGSSAPVARRAASRKTFAHPEVGPITLDCDVLTVAGSDLRLVVYTAAPGSADAEALALLGAVGLQAF